MALTSFLSSSSQRAQGVRGEFRVCAVPSRMPAPGHECDLHWTRKEQFWCYPHASAADPQGWPTTIPPTPYTPARPVLSHSRQGLWLRGSRHVACLARAFIFSVQPSDAHGDAWSQNTDQGTVNRVHWQPAFTVPDICHHCFIILIKRYHILTSH